MTSQLDLKFPNIDPMKCLSKVANKANLTENTKLQAINISCLKTREDKTQVHIAKASGVTEVTIRNRYKELKNNCLIRQLPCRKKATFTNHQYLQIW
jgi:transcription initiation factor TFIIB